VQRLGETRVAEIFS